MHGTTQASWIACTGIYPGRLRAYTAAFGRARDHLEVQSTDGNTDGSR